MADDEIRACKSMEALMREATELRLSDPRLVPPLAQTTDYARAALTALDLPPEAIDQLLETRATLSHLLKAAPRFRAWLVISQAALFRPSVWKSATQRGQMRHLLSLMDTGRVVVQVMPLDSPKLPLLRVPQLLLSFVDGTELAHQHEIPELNLPEQDMFVETYESELGAPADIGFGDAMPSEAVGTHAQAFDELRAAALTPEASRALIDAATFF
jgi:hypothetical protein